MLGVVLGEALTYAFEDPARSSCCAGSRAPGSRCTWCPATGGEGDAALVLDAAVDAFLLYALPDGHPLVEAVLRRRAAGGRPERPQLAGPPVRGDRRARGGRGGGGAPALARPHAAGRAEPAVLARRPRRPAAARRTPAAPRHPRAARGLRRRRSGARWQLNDRAHGEAAAGVLLDGPEPPTGLLCMSDELAIGALRAAAARGLSVPGELSVVGWDDTPRGRAGRG